MKAISTLSLYEKHPEYLKPVRASGNTTRLVDYAIQLLFEGHEVIVNDHHEMGKNRLCNEILADKISKRLYTELRGELLVVKRINNVEFSIKLKRHEKET